jgi:hypothetical protein
MQAYETLTEAIDALRVQGYTKDFNLQQDKLTCREDEIQIFHDEFHVDHYYRFEGMTDPSDESVVYAISSEKHKVKGILVNGYGVSTEPITDELLEKLR